MSDRSSNPRRVGLEPNDLRPISRPLGHGRRRLHRDGATPRALIPSARRRSNSTRQRDPEGTAPGDRDQLSGLFDFTGEGQSWQKVMTFTRTGDKLKRAEEEGAPLPISAAPDRRSGHEADWPRPCSFWALTACGGPSDEDVLTERRSGLRNRRRSFPKSSSAKIPSRLPLHPGREEPLANELENELIDNASSRSRAALSRLRSRARWGTVPADCRPGEVRRQRAGDQRRHDDVRRVRRPAEPGRRR